MESDEEKTTRWLKRIEWSKAREPYRTIMNTLASQWVEGAITDGELAIEILRLRDKACVQVALDLDNNRVTKLPDVEADLQILNDALLDSLQHKDLTEDGRRTTLQIAIDVDRETPPVGRFI